MNMLTPSALVVSIVISLSLTGRPAQAQDAEIVRTGEAAFAFASGAIQKTTPRDGIVNLITGDNQATSNRMLLGKGDVFYLKLTNPTDVAVGDLFTVYKKVRKVFHPLTNTYLGFVMLRLAVVKVTATDRALTTVQTVTSYGQIAPGDPVMRFVPPSATNADIGLVNTTNLTGMIVEIQADKPMTMVSYNNVVYLDRGNADGLKAGDLLDIQRRSAGLPVRIIGQLKIVATEERTATARIIKATTRVFKGDRFTLVGYSEPMSQPVEITPIPPKTEQAAVVPPDLVASKLSTPEASGQSRINLGNLDDFLRYESGEAAIRPDGYKVLDQLIEHLRTSDDARLIRVEGHTDNVEIGPSLKARYPRNMDLSNARAGNIARYLIEKGGVDQTRLQSVGFGDSKPVATNTTEEGRSKNRRVEIVLYNPDTASQTPKSDSDNQTPQDESHPSESKPQGTTSMLPARDSSSPASDSERSAPFSTSESPQQNTEGNRSGTSSDSDTRTVTPSDGQQKAQGAAGDNIGTESGTPRSASPAQEAGNQSDAPLSAGSAAAY